MSAQNILEVENLSKEYIDEVGYKISLLKNLSFTINERTFTSIIAPIGSGKTSLLRIITGLGEQFNGKINNVLGTKPFYIPSKSSSYPWFNVKQNVVFGLKYFDNNHIKEVIKLVGLEGYDDHYPHNKSVGFRFRISLAMVLSRKPQLIALDEPFNKMDSVTKWELYSLVRKIHEKLGLAFLLGTTNITEAIFLSDKIYLMKKNPGEIIGKINVELGKERVIDLIDSKEFTNIRREIESIIKSHETQKLFTFSI